jgi:hypothetical protein
MARMAYWLTPGILGGLAVPALAVPGSQSAEELLSRLEARAAQLRDYQVNAQTAFQGRTIRLKIYFKQPDLVRIDTAVGQVTVQPNGEIRGRLGKGPLGKESEKIDRSDHRLRDAEGTPFWEMYFGATLSRIRAQMQAGATVTAAARQGEPMLEVRSGPTVWTYVIDPDTVFFREIDRSDDGKQVGATRYSSFQPNLGLETSVFQFQPQSSQNQK